MFRYFYWILLFCIPSLFIPSLMPLCGEEENVSEPSDPFDSSLVKSQNLISTIVNSVSAISGEWIHSETDFAVLGPEPLILNRYYTADSMHHHRTGYHWDFSRPQKLMIDFKEKNSGRIQALARLQQTSGIATIHEAKKKEKEWLNAIVSFPLSRTRGLTNCRGEISAKTNLHNTNIHFQGSGNHCVTTTGSGHLTYYKFSNKRDLTQWRQGKIGAGTYKNRLISFFSPVYEKKPNGNAIAYRKRKISAVNSTNTQEYGSIHFHDDGLNTLKVEASDGRSAEYRFSLYYHNCYEDARAILYEKDRFYLSEAIFSHKPAEKYEYTEEPPGRETHHVKFPLLKSKRLPEGRFQEVEYYSRGKNSLEMISKKGRKRRSIAIDSKKDFRVGRVKVIKEPVGHDATPIITHRFIYEADAPFQSVKKTEKFYSGRTKVYDAYLRKTVYEYNAQHRPARIRRYAGKDLYSEECFVWDERFDISLDMPSNVSSLLSGKYKFPQMGFQKENPSDQEKSKYSASPELIGAICDSLTTLLNKTLSVKGRENLIQFFTTCLKANIPHHSSTGNLLGKYLRDAEGNIEHAQFFEYDNRGNITRSRLYGNLTGADVQKIELDAAGMPKNNGCESYEKRFTYFNDRFNLLMTEEEVNGKRIVYEYYPETDLVAAKYTEENGVIRQRQFYDYDAHATLIRMIKDDGCARGESNWEGVAERQITTIQPTAEAPFGLPACVEHKYIDNIGARTEKLLKKTECLYSREGHLLREDCFDANAQHRYSLYWDYDAHGNVIREVNALGHEILKEYDSNDNLIRETGPRPGDSREYTYDYSNRLISTKFEEEGKNWTTHCTYDLVGNRIAEIDRRGNETKYEFDDFNRLIRTISPFAGEERPVVETHYDSFDRKVKEIDAGGFATEKTYNSRGSPLTILHPDGQLERFEYHLDGTLAKKTASNGTSTHYAYDCFGRLLEEKAFSPEGTLLYESFNAYNSFHKISSTDPSGVTTHFEYDGASRLVKTVCEDKIELYAYDDLNRQAKKIEPFDAERKRVSCTEYDLLGRVIEERIEDEQGEVLKRVFYRYDFYGNRTHVIEESAAGISTTITQYNSGKMPVRCIDPEGNETRIEYGDFKNSSGQIVLQTRTTDPLGRQTIVTFDALERPVNIRRQDMNGVLLASQDLAHDPRGHLIRLLDHAVIHGEIIRSAETVLAYQEMGQLEWMIQAKGLPEQRITRSKYNSHGQKEQLIKSDGTILFHTYDPLGRLENYYSSDQTIHYRYRYNRRNQMIEVEDLVQKAKTIFEYDARGMLNTETLSTGLSMAYSYDGLDRPASLQFPGSNQVIYKYDALNLKEIERVKEGKSLYSHRYDLFDLAGLNVKSTTLLQEEITKKYDQKKRPLAFESRLFKQKEAAYDPAGRIRSCHVQDAAGDLKFSYDYDDNDHLIREEGYNRHEYVCDSLHNRLSKNQVSCSFNGLHQLIHNGQWTFTYDHAGNLASKENGGETVCFRYDALDRLVAIESGGETIRYIYDPLNRRVAKVASGCFARYLYAGQNEIGTVDETGNIQEFRVLGLGHGAEIGASIAIELQGNIYTPLHDFQGHIVSLADLSGNPAETYRYSAFGEMSIYNPLGEKILASEVRNPWGFCGKRMEAESGFIDFGRRFYDPVNGRWITADPLGLADGPNLYAYLHHRPVQAFDLYGLQEEPYTPLQNVDFHDRSPKPSEMANAASSQEAPMGFVEKQKSKKDRLFFCGMRQLQDIGISWINGIMNGLNDSHAAAKAASEMADDHYVTFVHNESHGFFFDLVRCFFELYFYMNTDSVRNLQKRWDAHFEVAGPLSFIFHICHSEGAIITRNALLSYPEELRQRIIILAIAPAAYIDKQYAHEVTHYRSTRDIVPFLDFVGALRCRDSTFVLKAHPNAPLFDHSISSPTYRNIQQTHLDLYLEEYGGFACGQ